MRLWSSYHERRDKLHWVYSLLVLSCWTCKSFWLSLILFASAICLNNVFLWNVMYGIALNTFPSDFLMFDICQCLLIIHLIFDKVGPYVTKNGITSFRILLVLFNRVDLSRLSTFLKWFPIMFPLYPFSTTHLNKSLECFLHSAKVEQTCFILNEDVQILHAINFGG